MNQVCKLLIVDDDEIIREGLVRNIPWENHGFTVVGTARNGQEGLELAREHQPQLILSDIRMPFMDGLRMAEAVKTENPAVKVIFLTGYDEFDYARKAINLRASDYILKYADNEEILQAALKAGAEWQSEQQRQGMVHQSQQLLKEQLLQELLLAEEPVAGLAERAERVGLALSDEPCGVALLSLEAAAKERTAVPGDSWAGFCRERLAAEAGCAQIILLQKKLVLIFAERDGELLPAALETALRDLGRQVVEHWPGAKLTIGVGEIHPGLAQVAQSYQEALAALDIAQNPEPVGIVYFQQIGETENSQRLRKIVDYVRHHFGDPDLTLAKLAKEVNICPAYISTIFKKYQKINFSDYLIGLRMEKARELLAKTNLMTYEVAERTGYSNPQYFSVLFKKYTGLTPKEFKSRQGQAPNQA